VQFEATYFAGQLTALRALDTAVDTGPRERTIRRSARTHEQMAFDFDALSETTLRDASGRYCRVLEGLPEVRHLRNHVTERVLAVPEWSRSGSQLSYGARVYVVRSADATDADEIVGRNIEAVVEDDAERFDRYRGELHGYPDWCIESYLGRGDGSVSPEWRTIASFEE
jgi:hypothetical protein